MTPVKGEDDSPMGLDQVWTAVSGELTSDGGCTEPGTERRDDG